jgi:hypothetical protein
MKALVRAPRYRWLCWKAVDSTAGSGCVLGIDAASRPPFHLSQYEIRVAENRWW